MGKGKAAFNLQTGDTTSLALPRFDNDVTIVNAVALTPDGTKLVTDVWYLPTGIDVTPAQGTPDNLLVFDTATNQQIASVPVALNGAIAINPASTLAFVNTYPGAPNTTIQVFNLQTY